MEAVILCGVQGSGKTTLYRERFLDAHVRVSMDLLRTRAREEAFLNLCLQTQQRLVVDERRNPTRADRRRYVQPDHARGFKVTGYLVEVDASEAPTRATAGARAGGARARGRHDRHGPPADPSTLEEGFDDVARHGGTQQRLARRAHAHHAAAAGPVAATRCRFRRHESHARRR